ncbi:N-acetyl-gamma-glutamyl-phosphate reductase [Chloroflexota bacterium]
MARMKVGIVNVTGYAGMELARLLYGHPEVELVSVTGRSAVGQKLSEFLPHLSDINLTINSELDMVGLAFISLSHGASAEAVVAALHQGIKVVDISADFRLKEAKEYKRWYDFTHPSPDHLKEAVYGLVELNRSQIASARLVANPGCYPTSAILALAPALKEGLIGPDIIIDSKSGVSGAGRTLSLTTHYSEVNDNVSAYALDGHRHLPEIVQELKLLAGGQDLSVTFVPHLVPMTRGILTTCYASLSAGSLSGGEKGKEELRKVYKDFYSGEPFIKITDLPPQTKQTTGTNLCLLYPTLDLRTGRLVVISCLDNLVKGAAGQAIQCMNLMLGIPEATGLEGLAVYP